MAEYIKRGSAIDAVLDVFYDTTDIDLSGEKLEAAILNVPAADVEPVVRCRECKHHYWVQETCHGKRVHYCKIPHMSGVEVFKEFFCYYGERKEGSDND